MDYKQIHELLEKYFEGTTSLEEEAQLKVFFQQAEVPEDLRVYQPLFEYFTDQKDVQLGQDFDDKVLVQIQQRGKIRKLYSRLAAVAASLILLTSIWWVYTPTEPVAVSEQAIDWSKYEPKTVEEAYEITKAALTKVSVELNEGTNTAVKEVYKIQKIGKYLR